MLGYIKQGDVKNGDSLDIIHLNADNFNLKYYTAFSKRSYVDNIAKSLIAAELISHCLLRASKV